MTEQQETSAPATKSKGGNPTLPKGTPQPPGDIRRRSKEVKRTGPFVKYVGNASHRKITVAQWRSLDIPLKDALTESLWSVANDKMIESSEFSDEQLDYLLVDDMIAGSNTHAFVEVDYNAEGQLAQVVPE